LDFGGETLKAEHIHVEELPDPQRRAGGVPFRLGYAMTCHSAQGSEWPRVQIYQPDLAALSRYAPEVAARWLYTAVTRAGDGVRFFAMPASSARHSPNAI
jgi:exodeoxyribonuclease-5